MNKRITLLSLLLITSLLLTAQDADCNCIKDLEYTIKQLKKTPSWKEQMKGAKRSAFEAYVAEMKKEIKNDPLIDLHCLMYLQKMIREVKDDHLALRSNQKRITETDEAAMLAYFKTPLFQLAPSTSLDLDALKQQLEEEPEEGITGLYFGKGFDPSLAVIRLSENQYQGIVLNTTSPFWKRGQILCEITEEEDWSGAIVYAYNHLALYHDGPNPKWLLESWGYTKDPNRSFYYKKRRGKVHNEFKMLKDRAAYLHIGSFKGYNDNLKIVDSLYQSIIPRLQNLDHLILDIRDNTGGGQRAYNELLDALKSKKGTLQIHTIINRRTGSAAEHFTLEMKMLGAKIYGEASNGAINYRYPNRARKSKNKITPCYNYRLSFSTAKNPKKYRGLSREFIGITPDVLLEPSSDWLSQVQDHIGL